MYFFLMQHRIVTCVPISATSMTKLKLASGIRSIGSTLVFSYIMGKRGGEVMPSYSGVTYSAKSEPEL